MNGPQHYRAAEQILENLKEEITRLADRSDMNLAEEQGILQAVETSLQMAQVHATLALTATNLVTSREEFAAWREVAQ